MCSDTHKHTTTHTHTRLPSLLFFIRLFLPFPTFPSFSHSLFFTLFLRCPSFLMFFILNLYLHSCHHFFIASPSFLSRPLCILLPHFHFLIFTFLSLVFILHTNVGFFRKRITEKCFILFFLYMIMLTRFIVSTQR